MPTKTVNLRVDSFDELRDSLHHSGLFDMTDCVVEITCNMEHPVSEVQKMLDFIRTTINIVDSSVITASDSDDYQVNLREVDPPFNRGPAKRSSRK